MKGVIDLGRSNLTLRSSGILHMNVLLGGRKIEAHLIFSNNIERNTLPDQRFEINLDPQTYTLDIVPTQTGPKFISFRGEFTINQNSTTSLTVYLSRGAELKGKITNKSIINGPKHPHNSWLLIVCLIMLIGIPLFLIRYKR